MWEKISDDNYTRTDRLKVPGGWIVRSIMSENHIHSAAVSVHQVFVLDQFHAWEIQ